MDCSKGILVRSLGENVKKRLQKLLNSDLVVVWIQDSHSF
jgi:tyrosine-protein phosphatase YwqE